MTLAKLSTNVGVWGHFG